MSDKTQDEDLSGKPYVILMNEIHQKLIKLGDQIKSLMSQMRSLGKTYDSNSMVMESFANVSRSTSTLLQKNKPMSELAMYIQTLGSLHQKFEQEKTNAFHETSKLAIIELDSLYDKKMLTLKNYLKEYYNQDKIRMEAAKKLKSQIKKHRKKKNDSDELQNLESEYVNANFNIKTYREEAFRKMLVDENILFTAFMDVYNKIFKNFMVVNEKYSMSLLRNTFNEIDDLIQNASALPKEADLIIANPSEYLTDSYVYEFYNGEQTNSSQNDDTPLESNFSYESELLPLYDIPLEVIHQFISIDPVKQMDLVKGDLIICYTDVYEGWQYGININSNKKGWFPATYTRQTNDKTAKDKFDNYIKSMN